MRGRAIGALVVSGALFLIACGSEDQELPQFTGTDEEQVAATVNAMFDAIEANDGN